MSDENLAESIVANALVKEHEWSIEETRRMWVVQYGIVYIDESFMDIGDQLRMLDAIEKWLIDGTLPPPKHKLKVVSDEK